MSNNEKGYVRLIDKGPYTLYIPHSHARAVVQIAIGMGEKRGDYEPLANLLSSNGIVTAVLSYPEDVRVKGADKTLVKIVGNTVLEIKKTFRNAPYFLFGHGLGALLSGALIVSEPQLVDALIMTGLYTLPPYSFFKGRKVKTLISKCEDDGYLSEEARKNLFGGIIASATSEDDYKNCDFYTEKITVGEAMAFFELSKYVFSPEWYRDISGGFSVMLAGGEKSPLTKYGEGVICEAKNLNMAGVSDVSAKLFHLSHSVVSGSDAAIKEFDDFLITFINERIDSINEARRMNF